MGNSCGKDPCAPGRIWKFLWVGMALAHSATYSVTHLGSVVERLVRRARQSACRESAEVWVLARGARNRASLIVPY